MKKKALILGITGQDGSYMLELLIKKKYEVIRIGTISDVSYFKKIWSSTGK